MEPVIKTNKQWREIVRGWDLTAKERKEFDWMTREELEDCSFVRYRGWTYSLAEFSRCDQMTRDSILVPWSGYLSDSAFSGVVIKLSKDGERAIMGTYLS